MTAGVKILQVLYPGGAGAKTESGFLSCTENELGLRQWAEKNHVELVTLDKQDGEEVDRHLKDADVLIATPFHPVYLSAEKIMAAAKLRLCVTAGVGSDHWALQDIIASKRPISVVEATGSNVVSVAENAIMTMLVLMRNFVPAHEQAVKGVWDVAAVARQSWDLAGKVIGVVGAGRIGQRVLKRLLPFEPAALLYFDYQEHKIEGAERVADLDEMLGRCDVVSIHCPLHEGTKGLFGPERIAKMKKGAFLVNTARGAICDAAAVAEAVKSGHLAGYGGDVWNQQPAASDHPWRLFSRADGGGNAMTPHVSGTTIDAQIRYAEQVRTMLDCFLENRLDDISLENVILRDGAYVTASYGQRK